MEVIQEPFARLLDELHDEEPLLGRPQTYKSVESWPELAEEVMQLSEQLDSLAGAAVFRVTGLPSP